MMAQYHQLVHNIYFKYLEIKVICFSKENTTDHHVHVEDTHFNSKFQKLHWKSETNVTILLNVFSEIRE